MKTDDLFVYVKNFGGQPFDKIEFEPILKGQMVVGQKFGGEGGPAFLEIYNWNNPHPGPRAF